MKKEGQELDRLDRNERRETEMRKEKQECEMRDRNERREAGMIKEGGQE